jgi:flagellar export protein FliJ
MSNRNIHEQLIKVRRWQRDQQIVVVEGTARQIGTLRSEIARLAESILAWSDARRAMQSGIIKMAEWRENEQHRSELLHQRDKLQAEVNLLTEQLAEQRQILIDREKQLKQVERLHEIKQQQHAAVVASAEQSEIDSWAGLQARMSRSTRP